MKKMLQTITLTCFICLPKFNTYAQCTAGVGAQDFWNIHPSCSHVSTLVSSSTYVECPTGNGYVLILNEEFDGSEINTALWQTLLYGNGHAIGANLAHELEYYTPDNLEVYNGTLKIRTKTESRHGVVFEGVPGSTIINDGGTNERDFNYTSGCLNSIYKYPSGKYEIRCKMPGNSSLWPAFWLRWDNYYGWNQEIDIPDYFADPLPTSTPYFHCNLGRAIAPGQNCGSNQPFNCTSVSLENEWHTFSVEWDKYYVVFKMDGNILREEFSLYTELGQPVMECDNTLSTATYLRVKVMPIFTNMNIFLNVAVRYPNMNLYGTDPETMEIDYIKGWVKLDCNKYVTICNWEPNRHSSPDLSDNMEDPTVYTGSTITVAGSNSSCSVNVGAGQLLSLHASDKIIIGDGFKTLYNGKFVAAIAPCSQLVNFSKNELGMNNRVPTDIVNKYLNVNILSDAKLLGIYDILGRQMTASATNLTDVYRDLVPGVYEVIYYIDGQVITKKYFKSGSEY